jgi:hypothetical protein
MKLSKDTKAVLSDLMAGVGFIGCCAATIYLYSYEDEIFDLLNKFFGL